jgi:hypothetical protein
MFTPMSSVAAAIAYLARETTLSDGSIAVFLDRDRSGIRMEILYCLEQSLHNGDQVIQRGALELFLNEHGLGDKLSVITVSESQQLPKSLDVLTNTKSRHTSMVYWDQGVWFTKKIAWPFRLA